MTKKISVNREEHEALCYLRDVEHERVKLKLVAMTENYKSCLSINKDQCARLNHQDLELSGLRAQILELTHAIARAEEKARAFAPAKLDAGPQPLFSKSETGARR